MIGGGYSRATVNFLTLGLRRAAALTVVIALRSANLLCRALLQKIVLQRQFSDLGVDDLSSMAGCAPPLPPREPNTSAAPPRAVLSTT